MTNVTLSLDLKNADSVREDAYKMLKDSNWRKLESVDTVWVTRYPTQCFSDPSGVRIMVDDISSLLKNCAKTLKIERINYIAQIGNRDVIERQIVRTPVGYQDQGYVKPEQGR